MISHSKCKVVCGPQRLIAHPSESKPKHTLINPKNFKCSTIHNEHCSNYVDVTNQFVNNIAHEKVCRTLKRHKIDLYLPPTAHSTVESQTQFNKINSIFKYIYEAKEQFSLQSIKINIIWRPIKCHDDHHVVTPKSGRQITHNQDIPHITNFEFVETQKKSFGRQICRQRENWVSFAVFGSTILTPIVNPPMHFEHEHLKMSPTFRAG